MTTFGWRVVSVALIITFADALVKALTSDNEESGRELNPDARSAYFSQNDFSYLSINPIGTSLVVQSIQCALTCLQHLSCFSFNLAAFPDDNGKLLCEHLSSDKYNNSEKFVASNTYHHFSIWSPCFSAPCKNNRKCLPLYKQNSYLCVCNKEFMEKHCENWRGECRQLLFPSSLQKTGRRLIGHNITIKLVQDIDECEKRCNQQPCCVSINFRTIQNTRKLHRCELNNATHNQYAIDLAEKKGFIYRGAEVSGKVINI
ncbi:uncharacterized protein LOC122962742 [Acropora millepora]|uniref:uncharacterized protein LOC122962742 n=1 Tax=Acropora millepora TaxID=45264 RepID=UPI001CF43C53|nr:uncharacterized protein LOC122962742 [Acropora millepora]